MRLICYLSPGFPRSLFQVLAAIIGAEITFDEALSGPAPGEDPFRDGSADLGWVCSTSFVDLALASPEPSIQLAGVGWIPDDAGAVGRPVYFGDVVVQDGSPVRRFEDLAGRRIGCNDPVSLSGHHALRIEAARLGHDPESFAEVVFTGGHNRSLDLLVAGEIDAAAVDSVVRTRRARDDADVAGLAVIERLGPWPVQPLVARASLPRTRVADVRHALLAARHEPAVVEQLRLAALAALVEVGPDHYQSVRDAMIRVG